MRRALSHWARAAGRSRGRSHPAARMCQRYAVGEFAGRFEMRGDQRRILVGGSWVARLDGGGQACCGPAREWRSTVIRRPPCAPMDGGSNSVAAERILFDRSTPPTPVRPAGRLDFRSQSVQRIDVELTTDHRRRVQDRLSSPPAADRCGPRAPPVPLPEQRFRRHHRPSDSAATPREQTAASQFPHDLFDEERIAHRRNCNPLRRGRPATGRFRESGRPVALSIDRSAAGV